MVRGIEQLGDKMIAAGSPFSAPLIACKNKDRYMTQVIVVGFLNLMAISSQENDTDQNSLCLIQRIN